MSLYICHKSTYVLSTVIPNLQSDWRERMIKVFLKETLNINRLGNFIKLSVGEIRGYWKAVFRLLKAYMTSLWSLYDHIYPIYFYLWLVVDWRYEGKVLLYTKKGADDVTINGSCVLDWRVCVTLSHPSLRFVKISIDIHHLLQILLIAGWN